ncbi:MULTISPECIES: AHH domain-containing protein [unclassified Corallococcus]|uniref:AHH domain-containing protein n=1 Tax=unclassified Corallococcus TaxID=2685029 RepID=UPI001A8F05BF|nr:MULTISPECIES: AHH domain-containing protein [unclassified Corallococcus]MBN9686001.1 AHH domain-containing protein [Corallococcus sp. NCSPR001]WAS82561.1 AHH domain-containing protein [Corallococcus sp. NCRR]
MLRGWLCLLLLLTGCASNRVVRLDTGRADPVVVTPRVEEEAPLEDAELTKGEFKRAVSEFAREVRPFAHPLRDARTLFGMPERSGVFGYEASTHRIRPLGEAEARELHLLDDASAELTRAYGRWCERKKQGRDCLSLQEEGPLLGSDGRYALALALAMDSVWEETAEALRGVVNPQAVLATVTASVTVYLLLWSLPEPVSKGLAALMTATAIAYLGVDTVWGLLNGWLTLVRQADRALTFDDLREAGEGYGKVLGRNAARVFVMLATAAVGNTVGLAAKTPVLPGSAQAALAVEAQAGYSYAGIGGVRSVAMTAEGFTIALAPNAVAMSSDGGSQKHHLATLRNNVSTHRGGPWTPRFQRIFKKAGMELKDAENVVEVPGHRGPHPEEYHRTVYKRLYEATEDCRTVTTCRTAIEEALRRLAREVATPGSDLNLLVTHGARP